MQIRRNTKAFKTILEIVSNCQNKADRRKVIRLYITKAGKSIHESIKVEEIQGDVDFFYDLNYQAVLNNLQSSTHQLHQSDEFPGIYFFHSTISKDWDETPFEFDPELKNEFGSLPELPVFRDKGAKTDFTGKKKETVVPTAAKKSPVIEKPVMMVVKGPPQPDYKLKHSFQFNDLDRLVFRQEKVSKKDLLDHYDRMADYLLPYLKDRPMRIAMRKSGQEIPDWVQTVSVAGQDMYVCSDKEHLMLFAELGTIQFDPCYSRKKSLDTPDYIVVRLESGSEFQRAVDAALVAHEILTGLQLPSSVKTDGVAGLHVYIPLDSKSTFETSKAAAEYICKLIRLKSPSLVALSDSEENSYGKVLADFSTNRSGVGVIAPYSFIAAGPVVATPVLWDEVNEDLRPEEFNYETIFDRLEEEGDLFEDIFKKKINAEELLERLEGNYSFLV